MPDKILQFFLDNPQFAAQGALIALFVYGIRSVIPGLLESGLAELRTQRELDREERRLDREDVKENIIKITASYDVIALRTQELSSQVAMLAQVTQDICRREKST